MAAQFVSPYSPTVGYGIRYDSFGRPVGLVGGNGGATELWGTTTTALDGAGVYDALGRISDGRGYVQSNGGTVTTKRTYGVWSGQLQGQETKLGATDLYRVGGMGYLGEKLVQMTDQGTGTSYGWAYDGGGRLVTATATSSTSSGLTQSYSHSFAFSPVWNLSAANVSWNGSPTSTQGYAYAGTDQATVAPGGYQAAYALSHDGMGNVVDRRVPGSQTPAETFTYTAEGHLRTVVRGGSTDEVLHYDALGNLAYRRSGTYLWFYVGDHATITATTTCTADPCAPTAGTVRVNVHVLLAGARIATIRTTPGQTTDQAFGNVLYYHRDRQGSVVATTTTGGVLGAQYRYGPYGELDRYAGNEATAGSDLGYTGGLRLTGGLVHLKARVYDPSYRRFLQADLVDPLRFTYTNGDPTNYIDPSGRAPSGPGSSFFAQFSGQGPWFQASASDSTVVVCGPKGELCAAVDEQILNTGRPGQPTPMQRLEADRAYFENLLRPPKNQTNIQVRKELFAAGATAIRIGMYGANVFRGSPLGLFIGAGISYAFTGDLTASTGGAAAGDIVTTLIVTAGLASGTAPLVLATIGFFGGMATYLAVQQVNGEQLNFMGAMGAGAAGAVSAGTLGLVNSERAQRLIGEGARALSTFADANVAAIGTGLAEGLQRRGALTSSP